MRKNGMASLANIAHFFAAHPLTRKARVKAWARFVSWQIRSRMQEEVIVPWIAGQRLAVRRRTAGAVNSRLTTAKKIKVLSYSI
jgi:hypothetical protein